MQFNFKNSSWRLPKLSEDTTRLSNWLKQLNYFNCYCQSLAIKSEVLQFCYGRLQIVKLEKWSNKKYKHIIVGKMKVPWYHCWLKNSINEESLTFALSVTSNFRHQIPNFSQKLSINFTVTKKLFHTALDNQFSYPFMSESPVLRSFKSDLLKII